VKSKRVVFSILIVACIGTLLPRPSVAQTGAPLYEVQPGDVLQISVWGEEELQRLVVVAPDGTISFPLVGHIDAKGKTAAQLQSILGEKLATYITSPVLTVSIEEINGNKIYVLGQVNEPGAFVMNPALDIMQALSLARGTTAFAAKDDIVVLRRSENGQVALRFRYSDVIRGRNLEQNILLESGDIVIVP
jgi:polysaccharide export outer membrane protein